MSVNDLDDYKLTTEFQTNPNLVLHRSYKADWARGRPRVAVVQKWAPQEPPLGAGSFGTVRLETLLGGNGDTKATYRAVKQLRKMDLKRMRIDFHKELLALTKFSRRKFTQSQAFVEFFGWFEDADHIFIAMEYFQHGTLNKYITNFLSEKDARIISLQLLEGLKIMHEERFTHRDLKPENIFVVQTPLESQGWWVKIGDFGISKRVSNNETALRTGAGTPKYLAPEVHHYVPPADEESDVYTNAVDIWSFACVVYEILALQLPFVEWPRHLIMFCRGGPFPEGPLAARVSNEAIEFVQKVLVPSPALRPTAEEALKFSWLRAGEVIDENSSEEGLSMMIANWPQEPYIGAGNQSVAPLLPPRSFLPPLRRSSSEPPSKVPPNVASVVTAYVHQRKFSRRAPNAISIGSTINLGEIKRFEITQVYAHPDAEVDIVLVHGLNGNPQTTWTAKNGVFWPTDLLPISLKTTKVRILVYGYTADVYTFGSEQGASSETIHQHAHNLLVNLTLERKSEEVSDHPIIFVAHSLGGILVKRALQISSSTNYVDDIRSIYVSTYGIIFLGTPHNGVDPAKWGLILQGMVNALVPKNAKDTEAQMANTLQRNYETLLNINLHFLDIYPRFKICMVYEQEKTHLKGGNMLIVDQRSASPLLPELTYFGIQATHSGLCKFESKNSPGYLNVSTTIKSWVQECVPIIHLRWDMEHKDRRRFKEAQAAELLDL